MNETEARRAVRERSAGRCESCGLALDRGLGHSWAHRVPRSLGGLWTPSNGLALCGTGTTGCAGWAEHHPATAEALGWRVTMGDPADIPVHIWTQAYLWAWVLLDNDGCVSWVDSLDVPTERPPWLQR